MQLVVQGRHVRYEAMGPTESEHAFSGAGLNEPVRPVTREEQQGDVEDFDRLNLAPECEVAGDDGLGHPWQTGGRGD